MTIYSKNFYSTIQQYSTIATTAFDEGPGIKVNAVGINTSSIGTVDIDAFRQGVEITQNKHAYAGLFKISAGTPGHIIKPVCLGANDDIKIFSSNFYVEVDTLDPVAYIKSVNADARDRMIATEEDFLERKYSYNGVIEPLAIRSIEGFLSTELPFQMHTIRGEFSAGNSNKYIDGNDQVLTVDYVPKTRVAVNGSRGFIDGNIAYENKSPFYDRYSEASTPPGSGSISGKISKALPTNNGVVKYFLVDVSGSTVLSNVVFPFDDAQVYLKSMGISAATHGSDMNNIFNTMTGSSGNYVPPGKKSATTGFVYDNIGYAGTDSIAFGGMTY